MATAAKIRMSLNRLKSKWCNKDKRNPMTKKTSDAYETSVNFKKNPIFLNPQRLKIFF